MRRAKRKSLGRSSWKRVLLIGELSIEESVCGVSVGGEVLELSGNDVELRITCLNRGNHHHLYHLIDELAWLLCFLLWLTLLLWHLRRV